MTHLKKSTKVKYRVLAIIFGICFIASGVLSFMTPEQACGGIETSCYAVQQSGYKETLGVNNSYFGLIAFSVLGVLSLTYLNFPKKRTKTFLKYGIIAGAIVALYFLYLQFFVINAICKYCFVVDVGSLLALGIIFLWKE
jgi:uncharacterized membrane protein